MKARNPLDRLVRRVPVPILYGRYRYLMAFVVVEKSEYRASIENKQSFRDYRHRRCTNYGAAVETPPQSIIIKFKGRLRLAAEESIRPKMPDMEGGRDE